MHPYGHRQQGCRFGIGKPGEVTRGALDIAILVETWGDDPLIRLTTLIVAVQPMFQDVIALTQTSTTEEARGPYATH